MTGPIGLTSCGQPTGSLDGIPRAGGGAPDFMTDPTRIVGGAAEHLCPRCERALDDVGDGEVEVGARRGDGRVRAARPGSSGRSDRHERTAPPSPDDPVSTTSHLGAVTSWRPSASRRRRAQPLRGIPASHSASATTAPERGRGPGRQHTASGGERGNTPPAAIDRFPRRRDQRGTPARTAPRSSRAARPLGVVIAKSTASLTRHPSATVLPVSAAMTSMSRPRNTRAPRRCDQQAARSAPASAPGLTRRGGRGRRAGLFVPGTSGWRWSPGRWVSGAPGCRVPTRG